MTLHKEPKAYDLFASEASVDPYPLSKRTVAEELVDFATPYDTNGMVNRERIAAVAAELARQFWLEIEGEFRYQSAMLDRLAGSGANVER